MVPYLIWHLLPLRLVVGRECYLGCDNSAEAPGRNQIKPCQNKTETWVSKLNSHVPEEGDCQFHWRHSGGQEASRWSSPKIRNWKVWALKLFVWHQEQVGIHIYTGGLESFIILALRSDPVCPVGKGLLEGDREIKPSSAINKTITTPTLLFTRGFCHPFVWMNKSRGWV